MAVRAPDTAGAFTKISQPMRRAGAATPPVVVISQHGTSMARRNAKYEAVRYLPTTCNIPGPECDVTFSDLTERMYMMPEKVYTGNTTSVVVPQVTVPADFVQRNQLSVVTP